MSLLLLSALSVWYSVLQILTPGSVVGTCRAHVICCLGSLSYAASGPSLPEAEILPSYSLENNSNKSKRRLCFRKELKSFRAKLNKEVKVGVTKSNEIIFSL